MPGPLNAQRHRENGQNYDAAIFAVLVGYFSLK
jgi:hypothetical protein